MGRGQVCATVVLAWLLAVAAPAPADRPVPGQAQPRLPTVELQVAGTTLNAEVARSPEEIRRGLMFRERLADGEAMLFVFDRPQQAGFWMKNTALPLSLAYLDSNGVVLEIHDLRPHDLNAVWSATDRVRYALEVPQGWFGRRGVRAGHIVQGIGGNL